MRTISTVVVASTCVLLLGGCATMQQQRPREIAFDPAEYSRYAGTGPGVIEGQAFLVTAGGDVKVGAGREVILNPVTKYSTEWFTRGVIGGEHLVPADPAVPKARTTIADGEGRFKFTGLPLGDYYVACYIDWQVTQYSRSGGTARAVVAVSDSRPVSAVVTIRN